jgi:replicative DNA helicase
MSGGKNPVFNLTDAKLKKMQADIESEARAHGRVIPQAIELEQAVLGATMLDKTATSTVMEILRVESFYKHGHQVIFEAIVDLYQAQEPVDLMTVVEKLKKKNQIEEAGGVSYLIHLTNMVASSANVEYHARIVAQKFIQRELIAVSTRTVNDAFEDTKDVFEMLDGAEQGLYEITEKNMRKGYQKISELAGKVLKRIETISESSDDLTGTPSGFTRLDALTNGWQPSDLIILAARPGMGKTAFSLAIAKNAALMFDKAVAFFTLEMSSLQLVQRLISMEAELDNTKLRNAKLDDTDWIKLHQALERLGEAKIFIDETPALNIFELRAKARRLKTNHDIGLIVIDYLQLMSGGGSNKGGNREQEISTISRSLKGLAKELNVPVIALSQLSRQVEMRANKRPVLSDLRESGAIEQDADIVTFLYRPGYYDGDDENDLAMTPGLTEVIVAKHRNGATDTINIRFKNEYAKFEDMEDDFIDPFGAPSPTDHFITKPSRINEDDIEF